MANGFFTLNFSSADARRIRRALEALPKVERTAAVRSAFVKSMTPMRKEAMKNIGSRNTEGTGILKKSIQKKAYPSKLYSISGGKRGAGFHGNVLHLVDKGTKARYQKKTGRYTGIMYKGKGGYTWAGKVYKPHGKPGAWTDAWMSTRDKVAQILLDGLRAAIKKIIGQNI